MPTATSTFLNQPLRTLEEAMTDTARKNGTTLDRGKINGEPRYSRTFIGELFEIVRARLAGRPTGYAAGDVLELKRESYDERHAAAIFRDPHDGQEYRLLILPKWQKVQLLP